ncbi:MAG TPA: LLM class flavin-dependent oxidoreductase [Acidimicrobiales bacterium]|nr:LLM class flavin-dependent oxidoreductase [Acidimicrobiales bacterium]
MRKQPMRFGVFCSPHHRPGRNPTLYLQQDLQLCEHLDKLGFDEIWWGEHHSGGFEIVSAPDVFIAAAAERTRRLMLGTGVLSLPYHHPFIVAGRMTLLDHLTRGRVMFGFGPGALVQDAEMMGIDVNEARDRLEVGLEALVQLLEDDEPVSMETDWFRLRDARLNLGPYTYPRMELAIASVRSPVGPRCAGRFGLSLLSLSPTAGAGFDFLKDTWGIAEERAGAANRKIERSSWRLVGTVHVANDYDTAVDQVSWGFDDALRFSAATATGVDAEAIIASSSHRERVEEFNAGKQGLVGTPAMTIEFIERLIDQAGGFGTFLIRLPDLAPFESRLASLELFAHEVMPYFQGSSVKQEEAWTRLYAARSETTSRLRSAQDLYAVRHGDTRSAGDTPSAP